MTKFRLQLASLVTTLGIYQMFSFALCRVLFGERQYKHLTSVLLRYPKKSIFPKKASSDVSRFILFRIFTSDLNPTALSDVYRLFTTIVYLAFQVACFDAIFDCITNMIGRLFNLHNVKSTPNNQTWKRRGLLIIILTLTSHFTFSYVFIL